MAQRKNCEGRAKVQPVPVRRKPKPLNSLGIQAVDYKYVQLLRTFISERGKIRSRRVTGLTPQQQRRVAAAIENAREMALLLRVGRWSGTRTEFAGAGSRRRGGSPVHTCRWACNSGHGRWRSVWEKQ